MSKVQVILVLVLSAVIGLQLGCEAGKKQAAKPSPAIDKLPPPEPCYNPQCVMWVI